MSQVYETKLHPSEVHEAWIDRPQLIDRFDAAARSQLVLVAAPAGYGKTVLVTQWAAQRGSDSVAWVQLDPADNDPTRLWSHLAAALELAGCPVDVNVAEFIAMSSTAILTRVVPRAAAALARRGAPLTIVLEDCHVLRSAECSEQLDRLIDLLPADVGLVMVSRSDPLLRLGRLRVAGRLTEFRTTDLAFTADETATVLAGYRLRLGDDAVQTLSRLTEGWPAAVYLAALSMRGLADPDDFVRRLSGSDRFLADYLSEEVLSRLHGELREFVLSMSVFDRFDAELANQVMGIDSATRLLHQLERTNLFLIPLHGGGWFRFHHLFGTFARSALALDRPDRVGELQRAGARWFSARGHVEEAIQLLLAAGDSDDAAAMIEANWVRFFDAGRSATVTTWLHALRGSSADGGPAATITAAWMGALTGDVAEMRRRLDALEQLPEDADDPPDAAMTPTAALLLIRGIFGYDGPDQMLVDARGAVALGLSDATPWYGIAHAAMGYAGWVTGDVGQARRESAVAAESTVTPRTITVLAHSVLALCELENGNIELGRHHAERAMAVVTDHSMQAMPHVVHAYTAYGAMQAAEGRLADACATLEAGLQSRRWLPGLSPWPLIHHLLVLAAVRAQLGQRDDAELLLSEVDALTPWTGPAMALTRERVAAVRRSLTVGVKPLPGPIEPLTPRELEILHRLQGTQTLREIASDLYVSHNTVKTITLSVYRKLGAHSRAEAVAIARRRP